MRTPSKKLFAALLSVVLLGFLGSCSKGIDGNDPGSTQTETTTLYGHITDESGASLAGVTVSADAQTAITDANGLFIIKNAKVPKGRAVILAKKAGYFNGARAETPGVGGVTKMELSMLQSDPTGSVSASSGGTVNVAGGAKLQFDAGSFTTASGASYSGTVSVAARYLHPNSPTFYKYFSGDNAGRTANNEDVSLVSCGVLRVKLTGANGEELKLAAGKEATITYPKTANPKAPALMPLWYYDETLGMWKEDGSATLTAGAYIGKVSHFTDWNLDYKSDFGSVVLRVVCNGAPIEGVSVTLFGKDSSYFRRAATTGPDGVIRFKRFPSDQTIYLGIQASENNGLYYLNTPVAVNAITGQETNLGDVTLNSPPTATLEGTLIGCNNQKVEGLVSATFGTYIKYIHTMSGGFTLQVPSVTMLTANAMDVSGNNSLPIDIAPLTDGELRKLNSIQVCGPLTTNFIYLSDSSLNGGANSIALSPDGSRIAVANSKYATKILIFETATGNKLMEIATIYTQNDITSLQFNANNTRLIAYSYDGTDVFDISGASANFIVRIPDVSGPMLSDNGTQITGKVYTRGISIFSAYGGNFDKVLTIPGYTYWTMAIGFDRKENAIVIPVTSAATSFRVWSIDNDAEIRNFQTPGIQNKYPNFSEDGERLAFSADFKNWVIYNTITGTKMTEIKAQGSQGAKNYDGILLTNNYLFSVENSTGENIINYSKLSDGLLAGIKRLVPGTTYMVSMAVSRNENYLAASFLGGVRIWKLK